jgi:hypothetical protein
MPSWPGQGGGPAWDWLCVGDPLVTSAIIAVAKGIFRDSRVLLALSLGRNGAATARGVAPPAGRIQLITSAAII